MSTYVRNENNAVVRRAGAVCATWLIAAAGASQGLAQQEFNPFDTGGASDADVTVSEYLTVDLHVQDEELSNVLQMLSLQSQRNIVVSSDVSATISANLYNVTFYEALDAILNVNGYGYVERGNFIFVYTLEEIAEIERQARQPETKVIRLNYLNANDAAEFVSPLLSEVGQIKTNGDTDQWSVPEDAPTGGESFALSAVLVVIDYPENIEEIESLVMELDTRPAQVLVEATILQTSLNEANAFGIDFSIIGSDIDFLDFGSAGGPLSIVNALRSGSSGDGDSGGAGVSPSNNQGLGAVSTAGGTAGPATFKLGVIQDDFSVFMRLLDEVTDVTILSNPKVLTLNRQPARVLVGARVGYLNTTATQTSTTQTVEFLDTGTQLAFRPFISNDGMIRMELNPSVSEAKIRSAADATGAAVSIPDEITQELTTNVLVRDGATIVLGGLFREATTQTRRQVPILGDVPLIGAAFRGHDDDTDRSEIIFMITPTIVKDETLADQGDRAMDYVERVRTGTRVGLLPFGREKMTQLLNVGAEELALNGESAKALWKIRRSLELHPQQPDALRLREQLLNNREIWPNRSLLERVLDKEVDGKYSHVEPVAVTRDPQGRHWVAKPTDERRDSVAGLSRGLSGPDEFSTLPELPPVANFHDDEAIDGPMSGAFGEEFAPVFGPEFGTADAETGDGEALFPAGWQSTSGASGDMSPDERAQLNADDLELTVTIIPGSSDAQAMYPDDDEVDEIFDPFEFEPDFGGEQQVDAPEWESDWEQDVAPEPQVFFDGGAGMTGFYPLTIPYLIGDPAVYFMMQNPDPFAPVADADDTTFDGDSFDGFEQSDEDFGGMWRAIQQLERDRELTDASTDENNPEN